MDFKINEIVIEITGSNRIKKAAKGGRVDNPCRQW